MKKFNWLWLTLSLCLFSMAAFGDGVVVPVASPSPVPAEVPVGDFLSMILAAAKSMGGLSAGAIAVLVINLVVASMKVSFLAPLWDKLGSFKFLAAPLLSVIAGIVQQIATSHMSLPQLGLWLVAGAGAILLHELLDQIKKIPGVGAKYVSMIEFFEKLLKKPA